MSEPRNENVPAASEARWRSLVEHNPDYVLLLDRDTTIRYVNRTAHGFRPEDVVGRRATDMAVPEFREQARRIYEAAWDSGRPADFESPCPSPDGTLAWYAVRVVPIRERGRTVGLLAVARDLTERKREEDALRASEARFRALVECHPDQVLIFDRDGTIRFINRLMPGFREEDVVGRDGFEYVRPEHRERARALVHEVWDTGVTADFEVPANRPDGSVGWFHLRVAAIRRDGQTVGLIASSRETTERKRAEEERAALEQNLRQTQKLESLGVLAGGVAHDFNNLLTGVLGNANLARLESPAGSAAVPYLDQIEQICLRAADLCRQMLAYAGKGRFVVERLDLNRVVADMTQLLQVSIAKGVVLDFRPAEPLPPVLADASQMRQVVMNLVLNASEALGERGGVVGVSTGVVSVGPGRGRTAPPAADLPPGDYVVLEVSDDGPGMTEEVRARIFDPFFTTKFTGRGLGLAAVQGIVRGHKGAVKVSTEPGRGTTFRVFFPRADGAVDAAAEAAAAPEPWRGEGTVLVADDEETVRRVAARMLESAGFRVELADGGAEAVERFRADPDAFRLVLLDLTMPGLGGEEAIGALRRLRPDVRVILMSGYAEPEVMARFAGQGLAGFVQKPFQLPTLLAKVREALG
jgi:PAS domain S-box-containing protein